MKFLTALFVATAFSIVPVLAQYDDYSFWVAWNSNHRAIFGRIVADFETQQFRNGGSYATRT